MSSPSIQTLQMVYSFRDNKSEFYRISIGGFVDINANNGCFIDLSRYLYIPLEIAATLIICF